MIEIRELTKRYGGKTAVDGLSVTVQPGIVTGFVGPSGAGKSTTMRVIIGLDAPSSGEVRVGGRRYRDFPAPLHEVGALEAPAVHPGRTADKHLLALARTHGIGRRRVLWAKGAVLAAVTLVLMAAAAMAAFLAGQALLSGKHLQAPPRRWPPLPSRSLGETHEDRHHRPRFRRGRGPDRDNAVVLCNATT